jgi:hypothetical protein
MLLDAYLLERGIFIETNKKIVDIDIKMSTNLNETLNDDSLQEAFNVEEDHESKKTGSLASSIRSFNSGS